ncbi:hypothetical protein Esti_004446 [Eimeria stiedai]
MHHLSLCVNKGLQQVSCSSLVGIDKPINLSTLLRLSDCDFTARAVTPRTAASQQIRQCAAGSKKQSHSTETSPFDEEHPKDCKPRLTVNQLASHAGLSTIASAVTSELKNPQQANAKLNAVTNNCSSAQSPLDQASHVKLSQQTVRQPSDSLPLWWRHVHQNSPLVFLDQAPHEASLAGLRVNLTGQDVLALLHTDATHSFVSSRLVDELQLQTKPPQEPTKLTVARGEQLDVPAIIPKVSFNVGNFCTSGRFLAAQVPRPLILGIDWLRGLRAVWDFGHDRITVLCGSGRFNPSVAEVTASDLQERLGQAETDALRAAGKAAHADLVESLNQLGPHASALVRKQPKRYTNFKSKAKRVPIQGLMAAAGNHYANLLPDQSQCLMLSAAPSHVQQPIPEAACGGPRISKSPHSLLGSRPCSPNQHKVEAWLATASQQGAHPKVVQLVVKWSVEGDVLVYTATFDEHLRLLDSVLARLLQHKMYHKLAKCKFAAQSIEYLGYRCWDKVANHLVFSKRLSDAKMRYSTYDQELLAIVRALDHWRNFLIAAEVTVYTDHQALQCLTRLRCDRPMRGRLARWLDFLADFQHLYQPGATNVVADALSRCSVYEQDPKYSSSKMLSVSPIPPPAPQQSCISASNPPEPALRVSLFPVPAKIGSRPRVQIESNTNSAFSHESLPPLLHDNVHASPQSSLSDPEMQGVGDEAWEAALQRCSEFGAAYKLLKETQPEPVLIPDLKRLKLADRVLCKELQGLWRICVPHFRSFCQRILYKHHDLPTAGHLGISRRTNKSP